MELLNTQYEKQDDGSLKRTRTYQLVDFPTVDDLKALQAKTVATKAIVEDALNQASQLQIIGADPLPLKP